MIRSAERIRSRGITLQVDSPEGGFTLLEILLALTITAGVMVMVHQTLNASLGAREKVRDLSDSSDSGTRVLALLERDLRGLWHHNIKDNRILLGRNTDIGGRDANRIDMLTAVPSISFVEDRDGRQLHPPVNEVGYWLRPHPRYSRDFFELWRREDPLIDEDITRGGRFQLVHSRIKSFKITYYEEIGNEAEELFEWDTAQRGVLPRRIKIQFTVEPKRESRNFAASAEIGEVEEAERTYVRHFVFDPRYQEILDPQKALITVFPPPPIEQGDQEPLGGGGGGPAGGPGGPSLDGLAGAQGANPLGFTPNQPAGGAEGGGRGRGGGRGGEQGAGRGVAPPIPPGTNIFGDGNQPPEDINIGDLLQQLGGR